MKSLRFHSPKTAFNYLVLSFTWIRQASNLVFCVTLFAFLFLILGCSKKDTEVTPIDDDKEPPPVTSVTKTIGSEGGTIALDSIIITIPAGAFDEDNSLKLTLDTNPAVSLQSAVTSAYKLEGLPDQYSKVLGLKLKYRGSLENDSYISRGSSLYLSDLDTAFFTMNLINCRDSSGYLTGKLEPPRQMTSENGKKARLTEDFLTFELWLYVQGISFWQTTSSNYFDTIHYSSTLDPAFVNKVGYHLDDIYEIFSNAGFNDNFYPDFEPPLGKITIYDERGSNDIEPWMEENPLRSDNPFYYLFDNPDFTLWTISYFSDEELRQMIGKEYFKQFLYYIPPHSNLVFGDYNPFNNSVCCWLEEKWTQSGNSDNFLPSYFSESNFKLHLDLFSNGSTNCEVIKYLVDKYGEVIIRRYYNAIRNGSRHFPALSHCIDDPIKVWLPEYFKKLFLEDIYNNTKKTFVNKIFYGGGNTLHHVLPNPNDTHTYSEQHGDLSAKVNFFLMDNPDINKNSMLSFSITSNEVDSKNLHGLLFSIDQNTDEITFIEKGINFNISDPLKYKDEQKDIFIVIVNSYYTDVFENKSTIQLDVILKEVEQLKYDKMAIYLDSVTVTKIYNDGETATFENQDYVFDFPFDDRYRGNITNDTTFTGNWAYKGDHDNHPFYQGEVEATIEPESLLLSDFDFKIHDKIVDLSGKYEYEYEIIRRITGINIQLEQTSYGSLAKIKGKNIVNHVNIFYAIREYTDPARNQAWGWHEEINFTENSILQIVFSDEN